MLKPTSLKISDSTTLRDLHNFSSDTKREGETLRARRTSDGHIELYSSPSKKGLAGKLDINAAHGRWLAQKGLKKIFINHEKANNTPVSEVLTNHVRKPQSSHVTMGVVHVASMIAAVKDDQDDQKAFGEKTGPGVHDLGLDTPEATCLIDNAAFLLEDRGLVSAKGFDAEMQVASELLQDSVKNDFIKDLGNLLHRTFEESNPTAEQRDNFSLSLGDTVVDHIMEQLASRLFPGVTDLNELGTKKNALHDIALGAYDYAAAASSRNRFVNEHEFVMDGVTYKADPEAKPLGEGGFGTVRAFKADDGTTVEVAVKTPKQGTQTPADRYKATRGGISEYSLHKAVEGEGHSNVLSMKGALRMPNGGLAIVLDLAKFGDMKDFSRDLASAARSGVISREDALLAQRVATRDMLEGLQHSHNNGISNQDVKIDNFLIDAQGVIKLSDNGAARPREGILDDGGSFTEAYLSPEMQGAERRNKIGIIDSTIGITVGDPPKNGKNPYDVAIRQLIDRNFPNSSDEQKDTLVSQYKNASRQAVLEAMTAKRDGFALGLAADALIYQKDYTGREGGTDHYSNYTMQTARLQNLVTDLSHPKFENRTTPGQALKDKSLSLSPAQITKGREVIVAVGEWARSNCNDVASSKAS